MKLRVKDIPEDVWCEIEDSQVRAYEKHRRGSNFYVRLVFEINEDNYSERPDLFGLWRSDTIVWDSEYGYESSLYSILDELTKVEKQIRLVETVEYVEVE